MEPILIIKSKPHGAYFNHYKSKPHGAFCSQDKNPMEPILIIKSKPLI